ncbi:MAG: hypothetical protein GY822_15000 [Deltaproteobacteria bacterium]|nr:hypothetical protein [Deltaproteobacteria bacterium]
MENQCRPRAGPFFVGGASLKAHQRIKGVDDDKALDRFQIDLNASERPAEPSAALLISSLAQSPCPKKKRASFVPWGPTHLNAQLHSSQPELGLVVVEERSWVLLL